MIRQTYDYDKLRSDEIELTIRENALDKRAKEIMANLPEDVYDMFTPTVKEQLFDKLGNSIDTEAFVKIYSSLEKLALDLAKQEIKNEL
ncbi:hypothetical protein [Vibrio phage vB_VibM_83AMN]|nr:hypothetical protein [Vibrio phage vB_VibM_83AMN]